MTHGVVCDTWSSIVTLKSRLSLLVAVLILPEQTKC